MRELEVGVRRESEAELGLGARREGAPPEAEEPPESLSLEPPARRVCTPEEEAPLGGLPPSSESGGGASAETGDPETPKSRETP